MKKTKDNKTSSSNEIRANLLHQLETTVRGLLTGDKRPRDPYNSLPEGPCLYEIVEQMVEEDKCEDTLALFDRLRAKEDVLILKFGCGDYGATWTEFSAWTLPSGYTIYLYDDEDNEGLVLTASEQGLDERLALALLQTYFGNSFDDSDECGMDITRARTELTMRSPLLSAVLRHGR